MRCLIFSILIAFIYVNALVMIIKDGDYRFIMNFSLIPVLVALFFIPGYTMAILAGFSAILIMSLVFLKAGAGNIVLTLLFLVSGLTAAYYLAYLTRRMLGWKDKVLEVVKEEHRLLAELDQKTEDEKINLEKTVYDISSLYQAPKKMISSTTLEELIECLEHALKGYFTFTNCKLIIFSFKDEEPKAEKVYNIPQKPEGEYLSGYEESLIKIMKDHKEPLIVDKSLSADMPKGLELPEDIDTFVAIPLTSGNRFNGIFAMEGSSLDDMVRFMILANQFSMVLERIRLYELVQELAVTDGLTGVSVRRYFLERLNEEIERARYFNMHLSFAMIDIDHFKICNDKYGHLVGDVVLRKIAGIMKNSLREIDLVGRYGGEEFAVILPETEKLDAAIAGERLRKAVEKTEISAYDEKLKMTISLGIATFPEDTYEANQLIDKADQMLYKAKEEGRNRVVLYE
jgi:diguanylate cyclase (GGDEF)-like protein